MTRKRTRQERPRFVEHPTYRQGVALVDEVCALGLALEAELAPEQWARVRAYAAQMTIGVLTLAVAAAEWTQEREASQSRASHGNETPRSRTAQPG
jgi:hypothetical protein